MAVLDIFKRKKKPDYLDLESTGVVPGAGYGPSGYAEMSGMAPAGAGMGGMPPMPAVGELPGLPPMEPMMPQMPAQRVAPEHLENIRSQLEALNYKIDTLKAVLDTLNTRLANIETALKSSPPEKGEGGWTY